jgi:ribonuclease HI
MRLEINFLQNNIPQRIFKYDSYPFRNVVKNEVRMQSVINKHKNKMRKKSDMSNMEMKTIFLEATSSIEPGICRIFTDGTKSLEGAGGAMYNETNQISIKFKLSENSSIFAAEATAVIRALQSDDETYKRHFLINKIEKIWRNLSEVGKTVQFCWIPSHCGIGGNEMADKLAKSSLSNCDKIVKIPQMLFQCIEWSS